MASDSRISAEKDRLIDEGVKVFEIPVVCRGAGPDGFFDQKYFEGTIGLACAGGTLVFQNVYGTLVPMLGNLISPPRAIPSVGDIADLIGRLMTLYVRSLGARRPDAHQVSIVVGGLEVNDSSRRASASKRTGKRGSPVIGYPSPSGGSMCDPCSDKKSCHSPSVPSRVPARS